MKNLTILGSPSSVGQQTLDVVRLHPEDFSIKALTARSASDLLVRQCNEFNPKFAVVNDEHAPALAQKLTDSHCKSEVITQSDAKTGSTIFETDVTVTGIPGSSGLQPTIQAVQHSKTVLIINKEPVVMLGALLQQQVQKHNTIVLPVDSEHNAIFQCSESADRGRYEPFSAIAGLRRILLAGTGGPFLRTRIDLLPSVTPEQAAAHPIWNMGTKISIDSATMMNKGLEIIEARWLFNAPVEKIEVIIHPQGMIHSMVEYIDGSVIAQMANPDMRVPIANALFWPNRKSSGADFVDVLKLKSLTFETPEFNRFPCLELAHEVAAAGGSSATVMNAANEVAVDAFTKSQIRFTDIVEVIRRCVDNLGDDSVESIEHVMEVDKMARQFARNTIRCL